MSATAQVRGPARLEAPKAIKPRRRHGLIGLGVALVAVGALAAGWLVQSTTTSAQVLAVARDVAKGDQIGASDLAAVPVQGSPMLRTVAAGDLDKVVGQVATMDLRSGSLLDPGSFADKLTPGEGKSLVGISLDEAHRPGVALHAGDTVRFVQAPVASGDVQSSSLDVAAVVVSTTTGDSTTGSTMVVNVEVDSDDAATLAALGASGRAVLLVDAPGFRPGRPASTPDPGSDSDTEER
ncbi:MAG: SAF domain-containing protein [Cellulomonas sp.]|jgi:hypothetical protein|nr:SAF domain-containing protein [Cellulomonas sp.]